MLTCLHGIADVFNLQYSLSCYRVLFFVLGIRQSTPTDYDVFTRETLTAGEIVRQKSRDLRSTLNTTYTNFVKDLNDQATRVNIVLAEKIKLTQDVIQHLERELLRVRFVNMVKYTRMI